MQGGGTRYPGLPKLKRRQDGGKTNEIRTETDRQQAAAMQQQKADGATRPTSVSATKMSAEFSYCYFQLSGQRHCRMWCMVYHRLIGVAPLVCLT